MTLSVGILSDLLIYIGSAEFWEILNTLVLRFQTADERFLGHEYV